MSGGDHDNVTVAFPATAVEPVSAEAVVLGFACAEPIVVSLTPAALIADTRNTYTEPLVSPSTTRDVSTEAVSAAATIHVSPRSGEYSTR